jgi:hypothetical protein
MEIQVGGNRGVEGVEELAELDGAMPPMELPDDLAALGVERCKEGGRAVALVVVRPPLGLSWPHTLALRAPGPWHRRLLKIFDDI